MERDARTVFAINPGSTSTKIAIFDGLSERFSANIPHSADDLRPFERVIDQAQFRFERIHDALRKAGIGPSDFCGVVGRGGLLRPLPSGVYRVNQAMLDTLRTAPFGEHASNLGAIIARHHADDSGCEAYIVDPVVVDEMDALARFTGFPGICRRSLFHALNQKSAAREVAARLGRRYEECRLIVAHLGGGISVGAHAEGRVIDVNNALDGDGPFSPERAGGLPAGALIDLCFETGLTRSEIRRRLVGGAGLVAHCGTNSFAEVKLAMASGDRTATMAFEAMAYQVSKEIAMHGATLEGRVDRIVLTGGIAYDGEFVERIAQRVRFLAPVEVLPGEREMQSLASGLLDVLEGRRAPMEYTA